MCIAATMCISLLGFDSGAGRHEDRWCFLCIAFCKHHGIDMYQVNPWRFHHPWNRPVSWVSYTGPSDCKIWWEEAGNLSVALSPHHQAQVLSNRISVPVHFPPLGTSQSFLTWRSFSSWYEPELGSMKKSVEDTVAWRQSPVVFLFGEGTALGEWAELSTGSLWFPTILATRLCKGSTA